MISKKEIGRKCIFEGYDGIKYYADITHIENVICVEYIVRGADCSNQYRVEVVDCARIALI